jgi:hypothetical protein
MTTPKDNALHLMEGQGETKATDTMLLDIHRAVGAYGNARACSAMDTATLKAELMCLIEAAIAPKTAHAHWVDEVEASGEAEPTRDDNELAADFDHRLRDWNRKRAPHFAIPPSTDVATLQRELALAYAGWEKDRKALGKYEGLDLTSRFWLANRGKILDAIRAAHMQLMSNKQGFWLQPIEGDATAEVQHVAARGAEVSE